MELFFQLLYNVNHYLEVTYRQKKMNYKKFFYYKRLSGDVYSVAIKMLDRKSVV